MVKKVSVVIVLFISVIMAIVYHGTHTAFSSSGGAPAGYTGSPFDGQTCGNGGCHGGGDTFQSGWISSDVPGSGYIPGNIYTVSIFVEHAGFSKFGFESSPQDNSGNLMGTLALISPSTKFTGAGSKYITHNPAAATADSAEWSYSWTAPPAGTGDVTFYAAMLAANGNNGTSGDVCYRSTLTVTEDISTCDTDTTLTIAECDSYTVPSGNATYTSSGIYLDTISNNAGCDSLITIDLSINSSSSFLTEAACDSFVSPSGNYVYTSSGVYMDTVPNSASCDSVITIDLTIGNTSNPVTEFACDSFVSPSGDYVYFSSGIFNDTLPGAGGCDSVIIIDLTIGKTSSTITEAACDSFVSPSGNYIYASSGQYTDTIFPNSLNCDSIITINLTIYAVDTSVTFNDPELIANQNGASYQWIDCNDISVPISNGQSYTAAENGTYAVIVDNNGCVDTSGCHVITSLNTGILENSFEGLKMFPNPVTNGELVIELGGLYSHVAVNITNLNGQAIFQNTYYSISNINLEMDGPKGFYFITMTSAEGKIARLKVLKH